MPEENESEPVYDGLDLHERLLKAAGFKVGDSAPFTKMAERLGEHQSGYNRAIRHSRALLKRVGGWCDQLGLRFVWVGEGVEFVDPCDAFVVSHDGVLALEDDAACLVIGDGTVIELTSNQLERIESDIL